MDHLQAKPAVQGMEAAVVEIRYNNLKLYNFWLMTESKDIITVHVNVNISDTSLQTIVENVKLIVGHDNKDVYHVDTASKVGEMISRFLQEKDFEGYVEDINNY